jgi:hypothetical protein
MGLSSCFLSKGPFICCFLSRGPFLWERNITDLGPRSHLSPGPFFSLPLFSGLFHRNPFDTQHTYYPFDLLHEVHGNDRQQHQDLDS